MGVSSDGGPDGQRAYAFGPFVVDRLKRRLWRDERLVPITSKTFDVLVVLLEQRDHIVSKDELMSRVWPDTAVNENNLARQVSSLRRALGQRPEEHDFIVTVPGHGYRFVAAVRELAEVPPALQNGSGNGNGNGNGHALELDDVHVSDGTAPATPAAAFAPPPAVDTKGRGPARWVPLGILAVSVCALVAVVLDMALRHVGDRQPPPRRTLQRVTYEEAAMPRDAAWAPDGQRLVYVSDRSGNGDLWTQRLGEPEPVRLTTSPDNESQPQWSPDGGSIVFRSERNGGGLYVIPAAGGVARLVSSFGYEPQWSPDGTQILFRRSAVLPDLPMMYVVGLDGRPPRPVRPDVLGRFASLYAAWHPDGRRIAIWGTTSGRDTRFLIVPLDDGEATTPDVAERVRQDLASISPGRFVWAASNRFLYFEGWSGDAHNVWRIAIEPSTGRWIDGPERLTTGAGEDTSVAVSPDGTRLLFTTTSSRTRLWAFPFDSAAGRVTGEPHPIDDGSTGAVDFDARSDGSKVAYRTVRAGRSELWEQSAGDAEPRLLLSRMGPDRGFAKPVWSPDGARLALLRWDSRDKATGVTVLDANGGGERSVTTPSRVEMQPSDWSKDGHTILGACRYSRTDRYSTCLVPVPGIDDAGEAMVRVIASDPRRNLHNQRFSPDQRWIVFLAHDLSYASTSTVYVAPTEGGAWRAITEGTWFDDKPRWGPDGRVLYFVSNRSGLTNVWGRRFDAAAGTPAGEVFPVTAFHSPQFRLTPRTVQMDIAITATDLLLPMTEARSDIWMLDRIDR